MSSTPTWIDITAEDAERSRTFYRDLTATSSGSGRGDRRRSNGRGRPEPPAAAGGYAPAGS